MKISDIARKFNIPIKDVRSRAKDLGFFVAQKSQTLSDRKAREFVALLEKESLDRSKEVDQDTQQNTGAETQSKKEIVVGESITVKEFSDKMEQPVTRVITELMKNGVMASINESIDFETAAIIGEILGYDVQKSAHETIVTAHREMGTKQVRPPVVAVIGHVDHGKTSLLDYIRTTNVVAKESGGITQHIGAYQVEKKGKKITFLDTPGHAAFSAMREHGVRITDIAILVVAADDGVKPQTKESIIFAQNAGVPIIVAMNKIDKQSINLEKVKGELADLGLVPEEWGGKTIIAPVSAKTGEGIDGLLDLILLLSDMKNIESFIDVPANGFVIESHISGSKGPLATVLVRDGILHVGDAITIGKRVHGKVRSMTNDRREKIKEAYPSMPVQITGLSDMPGFGEVLEVEDSLKDAKARILRFSRESSIKRATNTKGLSDVASSLRSGSLKELRLVVKADVVGSLKAIRDSLGSMRFEDVAVKVVSDGVGEIHESDIKMASATDALVIGFRVGISNTALPLIESTGVGVETFTVIYELIDKITLTLLGLLEPETQEVVLGKGRVLAIFKDGKKDKILGVRVEDGQFKKGSSARIMRDDTLIAQGTIVSLRQGDQDIQECGKGIECGVGIVFKLSDEERVKILEHDSVTVYTKEKQERKLVEIT